MTTEGEAHYILARIPVIIVVHQPSRGLQYLADNRLNVTNNEFRSNAATVQGRPSEVLAAVSTRERAAQERAFAS